MKVSQPRRLLHSTYGILRTTALHWAEDNATHWAATLAFYTMLSAGPLLFISVTIVGLIFGTGAASHAMTTQAIHLMGAEAARALEALMHQAGSSIINPANTMIKKIPLERHLVPFCKDRILAEMDIHEFKTFKAHKVV